MRAINWIITNALMWAIFIAGDAYGVAWAWNLFVFVFWMQVVLWILAHAGLEKFASENDAETMKGRPVPSWLSGGSDSALMFILASQGFFWMAAAWGLQIVLEQAFWSRLSEKVQQGAG